MTRPLSALLLAGLLLVAPATRAEDKPDAAAAFARIAELGPGVHAIKTDKRGRVTSCVVVGSARVSTVLGASKGLQIAREKAKLDASAQFVKWVQEKVTVKQTSKDETLLLLQGAEGNGSETFEESGKASEKLVTEVTSVAQGMIRGMQVLHAEQDPESKTYSLVLGWSLSGAKGVLGVQAANEAKPGRNGGAAGGDGAAGLPNKTIDKKSTTSPDADKFLP